MANTLEQAKKEVSEMKVTPMAIDGFRPVYVKTEYKKNKFSYGLQFWSAFLINQGYSRNSDGTLARFVELAD